MNANIDKTLFTYIPTAIKNYDKILFIRVCSCIEKSSADKVIDNVYDVKGVKWHVFEGPTFKMTLDEMHTYHCFFDKCTGLNVRFGKTPADDPEFCGLGPEILDLEISVNGCVPVPGSTNCRYCYKNNTAAKATNMEFDVFKKIFDSFPRNLSQIAFGITGLKTNPDLGRMFEYCRANGVIPNVTTVGADMDDEILDILCSRCGAVAVSCYTGAKQLCYDTIKKIHDYASATHNRDMHVNMHIVVSNDNLKHVYDVLTDIADGKVDGLRSVVFLRIKPKGRAAHMNCVVEQNVYDDLVKFCLDRKISFGFDSCSATPVMDSLTKIGKPELCDSCEPCESSRFSSYINVKGEYWSCSFAEGTDFIKPIDVTKHLSATEWWNSDDVEKCRFCKNPACRSCPVYDLDGMNSAA